MSSNHKRQVTLAIFLTIFLTPLITNARWISVDQKASKYPSVSPYVYTLNNPLKFIDPDGEEVVRIVVNIESATAQIYSDVNPVRNVPAAVTNFSQNSGPTAGTTLFVRGTAWGPVSNRWQGAGTSWQQNKDNPFGPAILLLQDANGKKSQDHVHGTSGPLNGGIDAIGGTNPENRKFTHGCTRLTNDVIVDIVNEGVKKDAPVEFVDDQKKEEKDE